ADAVGEELQLILDQRIGDDDEGLPPLAHAFNEEAGARRILAYMLPLRLAQLTLRAGVCSALAVEGIVQWGEAEGKAPLLHDLCLESTVCAANDHIGAYNDAPLATGGEPLTRDISRLEGVRWVGVQVGADKAPGLFDRGAGDAKLAGDLSEVVLAQR